MSIPRAEHPRPQFVRNNWINLNGEWGFEFDHACTGLSKGYEKKDAVYSDKIIVPFCPQSELSGIGYKDFMYGVWYNKTIELEKADVERKAVLHFGAVDYKATVYVNGCFVGDHMGGYSSFEFDVSDFLKVGNNTITVFAEDNERSKNIPSGKQSVKYESYECSYTRTTGIWQTVWLEFMPIAHIKNVKFITNSANDAVSVFTGIEGEGTLTINVFYNGRLVGSASETVNNGISVMKINLEEIHLWELGKGRLYDVELTFGDDFVKSYFGLRTIALADGKFILNGKSVFQRLVLDQGFYPDGIYTAPSDEALKQDILLSMEVGFNGARLHQKVFEERFLYHCDRLGYMVWGEYGDWGIAPDNGHIAPMAAEWTEIVTRDFNHPSIIGWCPHNECRDMRFIPSVRHMYELTKALDPTRPCIDTSGYVHYITDVFDEHFYDQDPAVLAERYRTMFPNENICDLVDKNRKWRGEPFFVSEFGGIKWADDSDKKAWGYGNAPVTIEEFYCRFEGMCKAIMDSPYIMGFCYTQLTDVEQEQNGIYKYDRSRKFNPSRLRAILTATAKIEEI